MRIGLPASAAIEPMLDWPAELRKAVDGGAYIIYGGHEYTGELIAQLDENRIRQIVREVRAKGIRHFAVTSIFSPVNAEHEKRTKEIITEMVADAVVTLSHEIGTLGLLERENSTILNCSIMPVITNAIESVRDAMNNMGLEKAQLYLTQNDGTVMSAAHAQKYPIFTVATGASNAIRGAYVLTSIKDAVVADMGGTTTNVGVLTRGFPRESSQEVEVLVEDQTLYKLLRRLLLLQLLLLPQR